ncbi:hypothetical protein [Pseudomonas sp. SCB32]|uniref:hypothetical protein n=1 Tax=Pseudomonas sp. SCB32 TaxID=2653853 RepID=UPI0012655329|nr:hypothetical protein [Pseudomonas sp. SCB32]
MPGTQARALRAVRSASFNNDVVVELLREITPMIDSHELGRRLRCATRQLEHDAHTLEDVWADMVANGACVTQRSRQR